MVGFNPSQKNLSKTEQAAVSAATSILSRFLIQPLDVVKIRFQVQYEPISKKHAKSKYTHITQTISTIIKEESIFSLWKGHLTGQVLSFLFLNSQFFWFDTFTRLNYKINQNSNPSQTHKTFSHFICGGLAASLTVILVQPIDTIRTRLITQGEPKVYNGIADAFLKIYAKEGFKGFYKGVQAGLFLTVPETAFRFGIYEFLNINWDLLTKYFELNKKDKNMNEHQVGSLQSAINGSTAGILSKTIVYPFDVVKKRLQIQGFEKARLPFGKVVHFKGLLDCFFITFKREGLLGLYKGYLPSMLKAGFSTGIVFFFYEKFSKFAKDLKD